MSSPETTRSMGVINPSGFRSPSAAWLEDTASIGGITLDHSVPVKSGAFGFVVRGRDCNEADVAVKVSKFSGPRVVRMYEKESKNHQAISSTTKHVPQFMGSGVVFGDFPYMTMEYIGDQTLKDKVVEEKGLGVGLAIKLLEHPAIALDKIHGLGKVYRDFKPSNILLRNAKESVLADFGSVASEEEEEDFIFHGSPAFMHMDGLGGSKEPAVDIYALAATSVLTMTGENVIPKGKRESVEGVIAFLNSEDFNIHLSNITVGLYPGVQSLLLKACSGNPEERPKSGKDFIHSLKDANAEALAA